MVNIYAQFNINKCFSRNFLCNTHDSKTGTLLLINPKLINNFEDNLVSNNHILVDINNNNILDKQDKNNNIYSTNKFDKKYKSNSQIEDILDIKKKKKKSLKKSRKQISLEGDTIFRNNDTKVILNQDSLNVDMIKVPKFNKNKKKSKNQVNINNNSQFSSNTKSSVTINKEIFIENPLTIQELSNKLNIHVAEIIKYLFLKGIPVTINQLIDISIASEIAEKYDFIVKARNTSTLSNIEPEFIDQVVENKLTPRSPIITILGHVDHGKTTLLDSILDTNSVTQEVGGITQSIKNYEIEWLYNENLYNLIFLDTPGHQAFTSIRTRSAQVTDIVVLVVAADDGLKPQTIESIEYIFEKKLPYIVVINKIDKLGINTVKVREELAKYNILDGSWGGQSTIIEVSALKKQNIDSLLSSICLLYESLDLKTNLNKPAYGTILETYLDVKKGPVTTLVIKNGYIKVGYFIVAGSCYNKIKILLNNAGHQVNTALASAVIQMLGFSKLPHAGQSFRIFENKQAAVNYINNNNILDNSVYINNLNTRVSWQSMNNHTTIKKINLIIKTDTQGSVEAIINAFNDISQTKVQINLLNISLGNISNNDIELASTSNSIILGFHMNVSNQIHNLAKQLNVSIQTFSIIYNLLDYVIMKMLNLVEPEYTEITIGKAIVQDVFYINKGFVAGCLVIEGKLSKNCYIKIYNNSNLIHTGILSSLKRIKDDVNEVMQNVECGVLCSDYNLWKAGDIVEAYELKEKEKVL